MDSTGKAERAHATADTPVYLAGYFAGGMNYQAVEKHPSASLRSSFVIATYGNVRLIPRDFARLASVCF